MIAWRSCNTRIRRTEWQECLQAEDNREFDAYADNRRPAVMMAQCDVRKIYGTLLTAQTAKFSVSHDVNLCPVTTRSSQSLARTPLDHFCAFDRASKQFDSAARYQSACAAQSNVPYHRCCPTINAAIDRYKRVKVFSLVTMNPPTRGLMHSLATGRLWPLVANTLVGPRHMCTQIT